MGKVSHTPAPWKMLNVPVTNPRIHMMIGPALLKRPVSEADARLISAAPDMLEALKAMIAAGDAAPYWEVNAARDLARAAIAKATGEEA